MLAALRVVQTCSTWSFEVRFALSWSRQQRSLRFRLQLFCFCSVFFNVFFPHAEKNYVLIRPRRLGSRVAVRCRLKGEAAPPRPCVCVCALGRPMCRAGQAAAAAWRRDAREGRRREASLTASRPPWLERCPLPSRRSGQVMTTSPLFMGPCDNRSLIWARETCGALGAGGASGAGRRASRSSLTHSRRPLQSPRPEKPTDLLSGENPSLPPAVRPTKKRARRPRPVPLRPPSTTGCAGWRGAGEEKVDSDAPSARDPVEITTQKGKAALCWR